MRTNNLTWDEMFFGMAMLAGKRSKDPSCQNGAVIVNKDKVVVGTGYNGFPRGIKDTHQRWERPAKYDIVIHAEENAIINSIRDLKGCDLYLWSSKNYLPCTECTKKIIQTGIENIFITGWPEENSFYDWEKTRQMLNEAGVTLSIVDLTMKSIIKKIE